MVKKHVKDIDVTTLADISFLPSLFDVHKILDVEIVGDYKPRLSVFTKWVLAEKPVLVTGPRSSGKTFITDHVGTLLGNKCFDLNKGSDKSGWYMADRFENASHIKILEFNKIAKDMAEVLKDWGEGKDSDYNVTEQDAYTKKMKSSNIVLKKKPFIVC